MSKKSISNGIKSAGLSVAFVFGAGGAERGTETKTAGEQFLPGKQF
jgi:hypothetical protein